MKVIFLYSISALLSFFCISIIKSSQEKRVPSNEEKKSNYAYKKRKKHKKVENISKNHCFKLLMWDYTTPHCTKKFDTQRKILEQYFPPEIVYPIIHFYYASYLSYLNLVPSKLDPTCIVYCRPAPSVIPQTLKFIPKYSESSNNKKITNVLLGLCTEKENEKRHLQVHVKKHNILYHQKINQKLWTRAQFLDGISCVHPVVAARKNQSTCTLGRIDDGYYYYMTLKHMSNSINTCSLFTKGIFPLSESLLVLSNRHHIITANVTSALQHLYKHQYAETKNCFEEAVDMPKIKIPRFIINGFKKLFCLTNKTLMGLSNNGKIYTIALDLLHKNIVSEARTA